MTTQPRVLVVDDAPDVQLIARKALERGFEVVSAGTLEEAGRKLAEYKFDLLVLDVSLPDGDGFEFCRKLSQGPRKNSPPVILLTAKGGLDDKLEGFSAGAEDYVVKPFDPSELYARAQLRMRNRPQTPTPGALVSNPEGLLRFGDIEFDSRGDAVSVESGTEKKRIALTQREYRLLMCLARAGGKILSRDHIIQTVWDAESRITGRTVDTHICKLRKKLSPSRYTIHSVYGAGYRIVERADAITA